MLDRLNKSFVPFTSWETVLLSHWSLMLWESNYTLCTFFLLFLNDILLCISFTATICTIFNQHHSKELPCFVDREEPGVWGCEPLLNCIYSESYFRDVTCGDAHTDSDTERSNAVNSPGSIFLASFLSEEQLWSLHCWMSQSHCFGNGTFLNLLETWKLLFMLVESSTLQYW